MELPVKTLDGFELMRLFVRIAETGSLSAAAQSLAISQPTASRQLKQLEQLLGAQLVRRSTHELTLTDSGKRFLEDARAMLAHWETSLDTLRNERRALFRWRWARPSSRPSHRAFWSGIPRSLSTGD
jgi:molybdate transport repressor ModE-like protein